MFSRALLVALCIVYATSLTPLTAPADEECALYLTGPGRSSAYDYSLNLLKGNFAYDGQHTCITYDAINQAYLDARTRILVSQPKGDWKAEDFASVGELILDVSISLARTYGLTYEEIEKGLPLIDTTRTLIREVCPPVFSHVECRAGKYRRLDGLCNNLKHPTWGATMAPFQRLIGPLFSDGINAPRISHTGHDLPLSRVVSRTMHPDDGFHDHAGTVMVIAWGQFMDHDYTLTGTPLDPVHRNDPEECCKRPPHLKHPYCNEIRVPDDDYFYRLFGVKCIDFVRGFPSPRPGCRLGSRVPFNTLTGSLDGNTVYGVTEKFARKLRTGYGGLLRMNPVFKEYGLKDLLPLKLDIPDEGCTRPNKNMYCFEAGEIRVNEQLVLTVMHTLMAREHNRVAEALAAVNPHWDDESLFQEARRINIAEIQHITYNEFLPILLGKDVMEKFGLVLAKEGYWDGYDQEVNPDVIASFAAAAYRFGHSLLPTAVERWSKAHKFIASKRLSDLIRRPYDLYRAGVLDEYVMGLMNQVAQAMDDSITQEVTNHLFKKVGARFGMDLVSFNMQRGREFGLPGYMEFRKFCGLSGAETFQDLFGSMANETIRKYESIFEHPIDVDLWSGGVSERPLPGSMLGPTFACIIATQFSYSRRGDRFWFELPTQPSSFTPEQLIEIRKSRLARVICDNTDIIDTVQLYPMVLPDHELNPRVPCRSGIIPSMDFTKWADPVPILGGAKEYITGAYISNDTRYQNNHPDTVCDHAANENCASYITIQNSSNNTNPIISTHKKENDNLVTCLRVQNNTNCLISEFKNNCKLQQSCTNTTANQNDGIIMQIANNNTLLKYVNKTGDGINGSKKSRGHIKNSLKRRKRTISIGDVLKDQNNEREALNIPKLSSDDIIKNSKLANFEVTTLHESNGPRHNNRYLPYSKARENTNYEDTPHQSDEYEPFIKQENKNEPYTLRHRQNQHRDITNNEDYLPETRQGNEKSEEGNIIKENSLKFQDQSDENYKNFHENKKHPNNILKNGGLRYYKDRKKKYYISKPNDQSNENISRGHSDEIPRLLQKEDDGYDYDKKLISSEKLHENLKRLKTISQKEKPSYQEDLTHINNHNFWNEEDENDADADEHFERNNKAYATNKIRKPQNERYQNSPIHEPKKKYERGDSALDEDEVSIENLENDRELRINKQSPNNLFQRKKQTYYNDKENIYPLAESKRGNKKGREESDESYEKEGAHKDEHKNYEHVRNDEVSIENIKDYRVLHVNKQSPNNITKRKKQINYNGNKNIIPLAVSKRVNVNRREESDESYEKEGAHKAEYQDYEDDENDEVSIENLKNDRELHVNKQSYNNILKRKKQTNTNDKKNIYSLEESERDNEKRREDSDESYEKEGTHKADYHDYEDDENDEVSIENLKNDKELRVHKQSSNNILKRKKQKNYNDKNNMDIVAESESGNKKRRDESDESNEKDDAHKDEYQNYEDDTKDEVSIENLKNHRVLHVNKHQPNNILKRKKQINYNDNKNTYPLAESERENEKRRKESDESYEKEGSHNEYQDNEDGEDPKENFKKGGELHVRKQSPNRILPRHNLIYNNDKGRLLAESKRQSDKSSVKYNRKDINKEKEQQKHEDSSETIKNINNNGELGENKQSADAILRNQNQIYYVDKEQKYPISKSKKHDDESHGHFGSEDKSRNTQNENVSRDNEYNKDPIETFNTDGSGPEKSPVTLRRQNKISYGIKKNMYRLPNHKKLDDKSDQLHEREGKDTHHKNTYHNDEDDKDTIQNFNNNGSKHKNKQFRNPLRRPNKTNYDNKKNIDSLLKSEESNENSGELYKQKSPKNEKEYKDHDEELVEKLNKITPLRSSKIVNRPKHANNQRNKHRQKKPIINGFKTNIKKDQHLHTTDKSIYSDHSNLKSNFNKKDIENAKKEKPQIVSKYHKNNPIQENLNKSEAIQEVDLGNFSYERIKLSNDGKIESDKDLHNIYNFLATSTINPNTNEQLYSKKKTSNTENLEPVIKVNTETSSEDSLNSNDFSTLPNADINVTRINGNTGVKQQFERIPLDYNHADTTRNTNPVQNDESEGTLDTLSPENKLHDSNLKFSFTPDNNKYDENLKIKFGDVNIKLPEVKLPDDILAQNRYKDNDKPDDKIYYNQNSEEYKSQDEIDNNYRQYDPKHATPYSKKTKEDREDGEYDFFASYIIKPNEKFNKNTNSDETTNENSGEDLYDKFVRERFGRKKSFNERPEKLQEKNLHENKPTTKNQQLFETIQKAIKKAEDVQKEAEKSEDPNASYLWTLEYGEKL